MDAHNSRESAFSILNDNDCPSFAVRPRLPLAGSPKQQAAPARQTRPGLHRNSNFSKRASSVSSESTPPLLRFDSTSSKSSSSSMDSSPSPITPVYTYNENALMNYDILRHDPTGYLPSPTGITPFLEQSMMLMPSMNESMMQYPVKTQTPSFAPSYPIIPVAPAEVHQVPTPASSSTSISNSSSNSNSHPAAPNAPPQQPQQGKKNKYPCPYAASHACHATFTTSGHAARHGKKHTGEKGVHCPVCNKAFTRKDNMKQHERTHKGGFSGSNSDDSVGRKSKAAVTQEALKSKKKAEIAQGSLPSRRSSIIHSPLNEVSVVPDVLDPPLPLEEPVMYEDPAGVGMVMPAEQPPTPLNGIYPPIGDETILNPTGTQQNLAKTALLVGQAPSFRRGFSDLDTLAHAAEAFDPYYSVKYE